MPRLTDANTKWNEVGGHGETKMTAQFICDTARTPRDRPNWKSKLRRHCLGSATQGDDPAALSDHPPSALST